MSVTLVSEPRVGEASAAAAGMLAPSVEKATGAAHRFAISARDFYPAYLEELADSTGIRVPLNRLGVLQVAMTENGVKGLTRQLPEESAWIDRAELQRLEPTLGHALGAVMNPEDGAVDNVILLAALEALAGSSDKIRREHDSAVEISAADSSAEVTLASGARLTAGSVVVAPGAWGATIRGATGLNAVTPSRGQLVSYNFTGLRHVTYGPRGYLVPRTGGTVIAAEYRFVGEQVQGGPAWAMRNNGLMLHAPDPKTMLKDQDFPISIEVQLLGGLGDGKPRTTANLCTPGTNVVMSGKLVTAHCINSTS